MGWVGWVGQDDSGAVKWPTLITTHIGRRSLQAFFLYPPSTFIYPIFFIHNIDHYILLWVKILMNYSLLEMLDESIEFLVLKTPVKT